MVRKSEFSSYVFIKNDLKGIGWDTRNPNRNAGGQLYTQQECLDHPEIGQYLNRQRPEYVVKVSEDSFWVIEAKGTLEKIDQAFKEAVNYAKDINKSHLVRAAIVTGVAGNDDDGYLVKTAYINSAGNIRDVVYNGRVITGFLSHEQALSLIQEDTNELNFLVTDEGLLLDTAEKINEELHKASINKDLRATVMSSVLLAMVSDTLPNINASPSLFIKEINNRAEDVLIQHSKREFAEYIELRLPQEEASKEKYKAAVVKVFFLLRKINVKAAMNGSQDLLGKFYEVFLKYGNGAKDIGIVLTPRHITEFSGFVLDIKSSDIVYDPACGTGGFLVAAYDRVRLGDPDGVEMFKKHRIFGVEQQANVAALAIVNMIFRGDGKNNIVNGDCLSLNLQRKIRNNEVSAEYQEEKPDRPPVNKVLMNPPFALKRSDEQEFTFIERALDQMVEGGLLLCVIPVSVMYSAKKDELSWRKRLLNSNTLVSVISFPNDLFYPQASVEPVIIIVKKGIPHSNNAKTLFGRVVDDGFIKLKKRRLPHGRTSQLDEFSPRIRDYIIGNDIEEVPGYLQSKVIDMNDKYLELIPQNYLDNAPLDENQLKNSMSNLYSELVFQQIRRGLNK